jgi:ABC-2 type transport system permease protein
MMFGTRAHPTIRRTLAMAQKESFHILRDKRALAVAFALPIFLVVLFGYGVSFDLEHTPLIVIDQESSQNSHNLSHRIGVNGEFDVIQISPNADDATRSFKRNQALAALVIPPDYSQRLLSGEPTNLQILLDGTSGTTAQSVMGSALGFLAAEQPHMPVIQSRVTLQYNPGLRSAVFLVPGLFAYVLGIVAVLLTSLTVAKEWERGNMEQLFATPVSRLEIVLGKLLPYMIIGSLQALVVLVVGMAVFEVPLTGSPILLGFSILLFLVAMLGQGLVISVVTRNQQVATMVSAVTTILPSLLLSGFLYPIGNMPTILRILSHIFPARYFIEIVRGILLKGNGFAELWQQFLPLSIIAFVVVALARARFQRRIA